MTNRINGDFDQESMDAFRAAYAAQIQQPEDLETDPYTGLPSNVVLNTSPWIQHTGLWKANDGTDKNFVPNQVLVPGQEDDSDELSEEELDAMLEELLAEEELLEQEDEDDLDLEGLIASLGEDYLSEEDDFEDDSSLIDENFETSPYQNDDNFEEEEIGDEEIDALIAELEAELDLAYT